MLFANLAGGWGALHFQHGAGRPS